MAARSKRNEYWEVLYYSDVHFPYQDDHCVERVLDHVSSESFSHVIQGGDMLDAYTVSSFDKDPRRIDQLYDEVLMGAEHHGALRAAAGDDAYIVALQGNHEDRVPRYLRKNAPAFERFPSLQLASLLECEQHGIDYREDGQFRLDERNLFKHGIKVAQGAGNAVRREMNAHWCNVYMGHIHRQAIVRIRKGDTLYQGAEAGCCCHIDPEYIKDTPDWHQGWLTMRICKRTGESEVTEHQPN